MKLVRFLAIAAAATGVLLLVALVLGLSSSFQTYVARRSLASKPEVRATVGMVSAGFKHVEATDIRYEQAGAVLIVPRVEADLPVITAGLQKKVLVSRLVARGWTLDLSGQTPPPTNLPPAAVPAATAAAVARAFGGVFSQFQLPVDVSIDNVILEGDVILPASRGRAKIVVQGGGLEPGREGRFTLKADAMLADPAVNQVRMDATVAATMDSPRTLTRLVARLDAEASGAQFPGGVKLAADLSAARAVLGESYRAAIVAQDRQLLMVSAEYPSQARRLDGTWKLDVRDTDVAPFALGVRLPAFSLAGEGNFDTDAAFTALHATGRLNAAADRLEVLKPELAGVGAVRVNADFDLARRGEVFAIARLDASINTTQPVATVRTLQAFEFNPDSGALKAADPERELLEVVFQGMPVAWLAPFLKDLAITGGDLRGQIVLTPRGGGMTLRAKSPLTIAGLSVSRAGQPLLAGIDFSTGISADYTPQGWQTEISSLTARTPRGLLLSLEAKAGRLAGREQPLKATGTLAANLPAWLSQPAASHWFLLGSGDASVEFAANFAAKKEVQARIALKNLVAGDASAPAKLPAITADVRADFAANGQVVLNIPIELEREGRKSDLTLAGTLGPGRENRRLEAQVVSSQLFVDDARLLAAALPARGTPDAEHRERDAAPPWAGLNGTIGLRLKKVIYGELFHATEVAGTLRIDGSGVKFEQFQAGLGEGGDAKLNGSVTFHRAAMQPYALDATLTLTEFDPGPLLRAIAPEQPPTVEGRFNIASKLAGRAPTLGALALAAGGDFQLTSRGGTFRGIPVSVASKVESVSSVAAGLARLGNLANAISGKNDRSIENIANRAEAVAKIANYWKAIPYDQLSVTLSRDADLNTVLKDFNLISPEVRLSGSGTAKHHTGTALLDDALAMEFKLRARGQHAELLKYLGALEGTPDDLGYIPSTLPLKVGGTLGKPDTTELNNQLTAIALEKSGVSDKAVELFNRLRGVGK